MCSKPVKCLEEQMRKLTAGLFSSIDGVVEAPNTFQFDSFDNDLGQMLGEVMGKTTTVLLGRVSYEEWAGYWPTANDGGFELFINPVEKFVASRTLTEPLAWQNSTLIEGDLEAFVRELKSGDGGDIAVMGSLSVTRQLIKAGLVDQMTLIVHPVFAGQGRHLFEPTDEPTRLTLIDSVRTSKGNVVNTYAPRD
jgi:dihydrofolate reductase